MRCVALGTLNKLEPAVLALHAVYMLNYIDSNVRLAAFESLNKLDPVVLALCSASTAAVVRTLHDANPFVRGAAFSTLCKLEQATWWEFGSGLVESTTSDNVVL